MSFPRQKLIFPRYIEIIFIEIIFLKILIMKPKKTTPNVLRVAIALSSDTLTPVLAFLRLSCIGKKAFLLESAEGGEKLGRYSFLGIDPREVLRIRDGIATLEKAGKKIVLPGNPFHALGEYLARYRADPLPDLPPFQGGAIGYLSYECAHYLEKIESKEKPSSNKLQTELIRDHACMMIFRNVVAFDHLKRRIYVISNIFLEKSEKPNQLATLKKIKRAQKEARSLVQKLRNPKITAPHFEKPIEFIEGTKKAPELEFTAALGRENFIAAVKRAKEHIRAGDIFQCVLSDQFTFSVEAEPFLIYRALQTVNPSPYLFYLSLGKEVLLGASPEMLVRASYSLIETCPIAGTRPRGKTEAEDKKFEYQLLKSTKEKAEHVMLVDLGRNDIGRVAKPGTVRVKDFMHIERFSHVMHLVSVVQGRLRKGLKPWDALASCFPAGTLSGAPKIRAMQIISELEPVHRNAYGGAVVLYDFSGFLDSCITIRSLFFRRHSAGRKGGIAIAQAGAGIVADSNPEMEYKEVFHKFGSIRRALALASSAWLKIKRAAE